MSIRNLQNEQIYQHRDEMVLNKPADNTVLLRSEYCRNLCDKIMQLKNNDLFTSNVRSIEDRFKKLYYGIDRTTKLYVGLYQMHSTTDAQVDKNVMWVSFDETHIIIHVRGEVMANISFPFGCKINEMCSDIVYVLCVNSDPAVSEPNIEMTLNDEEGQDAPRDIDYDADSDSSDIAITEYVGPFTSNGTSALLNDIACRIDSILSKL